MRFWDITHCLSIWVGCGITTNKISIKHRITIPMLTRLAKQLVKLQVFYFSDYNTMIKILSLFFLLPNPPWSIKCSAIHHISGAHIIVHSRKQIAGNTDKGNNTLLVNVDHSPFTYYFICIWNNVSLYVHVFIRIP